MIRGPASCANTLAIGFEGNFGLTPAPDGADLRALTRHEQAERRPEAGDHGHPGERLHGAAGPPAPEAALGTLGAIPWQRA